VVLVCHDPAAGLSAQPDGQPKAVVRILLEFLVRSAAEQRVREGNVGAGGDLEREDLERGTLPLPFEEGRSRLTIGLDAAHPILGWRDVEHHDVVGMSGEHAVHVPGMDRLGPALDQRADLGFIRP
jgi:hypothetical protein